MLLILMILSFICSLDLLNARPAEEVNTFDVTRNNSENITSSKLPNTKQINSEFQNSISPLITKSDKPQIRRVIPPYRSTTPIILFSPIEQKKIRLENETAQGILERRKPDTIRQILNNFITPKPIVDRINDKEKYGNTGDKFNGIGRAVVNGYENFSNFLNILTDLPVNVIKQASRGVTQVLNEIGSRIIGLQ